MTTISGNSDIAKLAQLEAKANNSGVGNSDGVLTADEMVAAFKADFKAAKAKNPDVDPIAFMDGWVEEKVPADKQIGVMNMITNHVDLNAKHVPADGDLATHSTLKKETFNIPFQPKLPDEKVKGFDFSALAAGSKDKTDTKESGAEAITSSQQKGTLIQASDTDKLEAAGK
jgi:hypothetical protein